MPRTPFAMVSSADWQLDDGPITSGETVVERLGLDYDTLRERCRQAVYSFVNRTFDPQVGAVHHYYEAPTGRYDAFDTGNFLIAMNFLTMYDRYGDVEMLDRAESCYRWAYRNCTEIHPMFSWQGGVRDGFAPHELYVKYTADAFVTALALHARRPHDDFLFHMTQYHSFLKRARQAGFAFTFDTRTYDWKSHGFSWCGFGGPILAYLQAHELLGDSRYLDEAVLWGEYGLSRQAPNGAFYLLDGQFWNSDLTALELRALAMLFTVAGDARHLAAARRYADWLLGVQRPDGAWPIGIDDDGEVCAPNVGPGDMPNIALSLLLLHRLTGDPTYLDGAVAAVRYAIGQQVATPDDEYYDDLNARWGFWSWDPRFDYTLSGDQVVHHVRGIVAVADHLGRM